MAEDKTWAPSRPDKQIISGGLMLFVALSLAAAYVANWRILIIAWIAFGAMALAIPWGIAAARNTRMTHLIAGYGLASGAMITSAAIFLIPQAINHDPLYGGLGIAIGIMAGFAMHTFAHRLTHTFINMDSVVLELSLHALSAGIIMGMVYATMPGLSLLLGVAIVSHKGPAGYAAARRLALKNGSPWLLLFPACAVGLTALPISLIYFPPYPIFNALIFGFATGVFFHVAIDFLPECEVGGEIHQHAAEEDHQQWDKFRNQAVFYTFAGGLIVFILWYISHPV